MRRAERRGMRAVALLVLAACAGARPAVIPKLSHLPTDPEKRDAVLDQSHAEPGPEQRPASKQGRKVETYAATAAAVVGWLFSDSENVTLGSASLFEEAPAKPQPKPAEKKDEDVETPTPVEIGDEKLVPWIRLQ